MRSLLSRQAATAPEDPANVVRARVVTVALFALVVLAPASRDFGGRAFNALGSLAMIALVNLAGRTRRTLLIALALGVPSLLLQWVVPADAERAWRVVPFWFGLGLDVYVLGIMLRQVFRARRVGQVTLLMAVDSYLLLGVIWAGALIVCEVLQPGSFRGLADTGRGALAVDLYYFSFVTIATLGYGDITPVSPIARSLAIGEVLCGVMFTAIIMARLISLYTEEKVEQP